ncbi:MAG: ferredoxin [Limisphaerales bacterium]|jgi:ferredoxin
MKVESTNNVGQTKASINWKRSDPATETETQSFWKNLRNFYRTGKQSDDQGKALSSALLGLLDDNENKYPFILGKDGEANSTAIELEEKAPYYLLDYLVAEHHKGNRKSFKAQLNVLIEGLNKLLNIDDKSTEVQELKKTYDFADELIAFEKMVNMTPKNSTETLSDTRLIRLTAVIITLQEGLNLFNEQEAILVFEKGLSINIKKESLFKKTLVIEAKNNAFDHAQGLFADQMQSFASLIKAYRIATLEINGEYKEAIHDEYFEHFTWYRLRPDELNLFQPIILLVHQHYLYEHLVPFSHLMASNQPINVMVLNHELRSKPDHRISWEDASHQFRQEIAALAIAHRNVFTFQSSLDDPSAVYNGLANCLESTSPGICYLSVPKDVTKTTTSLSLIAKAENASRYFPRILYNPAKISKWGGRFDLSENIQPKEKWPTLVLKAATNDQTEVMIDVAFTYADYKAIYPEKAKELMVIPSAYYTEHLIPLSDYLAMDEESLYGKIPYIWLIDEGNDLHRAAVPNVWVVSCQERLDFWSFLQELGGINSYHVNVAMKQKDQEMAILMEAARTKMDEELQQMVEKAQEDAITKAAERLISVLLDDEELQLDDVARADTSVSTGQSENNVSELQDVINNETKDEVANTQVARSEPWVESDECTSCNDCTDKYPNIFKYNEEKQAYIDDATKGTYEELVKAAENCPAACIHPEMPLNQVEPNLEKLIKRAEKFK